MLNQVRNAFVRSIGYKAGRMVPDWLAILITVVAFMFEGIKKLVNFIKEGNKSGNS